MQLSNENLEAIKKVKDHMEFLGYEASISQDNSCDIFARHIKKANINIRVFPKAIQLSAAYGFTEETKNDRLGRLEYTSALNLESIGVKYTMNDYNELVLQLWMFAPYDKILFSQILDVWDEDIESCRNYKDTQKFLQ